jgi:hypothetical protein
MKSTVRAAPARRAWSKFIFTAYFTVCRVAFERRAGEWKFRGYCYDCYAPLARVFVALAAQTVPRSRPSSGFGLSINEPGCPGIGAMGFAARRRRVADKEHNKNIQGAANKNSFRGHTQFKTWMAGSSPAKAIKT